MQVNELTGDRVDITLCLSRRMVLDLRRQALLARCPFEDFIIKVLGEASNVPSGETYHDLDELIGTWVEDPDFDAALKAMDDVDLEFQYRDREARESRRHHDDPAVDRS
jgi:hypothetical protein